MKIFFHAETDETITNFRVAEAVINLCAESWGLDADVIAKMILLQVDKAKEIERERQR